MGHRRHAPASPLADAVARVGDRWTLLAIASLLSGPKRFNELAEELGGIAPNVLSARLKALTEQALVVSRPYSERPPRFVYELSESGRELAGALRLLADWGARVGGRRRAAAPHRLRQPARGALVVPRLRADRGRRRRRRHRPRLRKKSAPRVIRTAADRVSGIRAGA